MAAASDFDFDSLKKETDTALVDIYVTVYGREKMAELEARIKAMQQPRLQPGDCIPTKLQSTFANDLLCLALYGDQPTGLPELFASVLKKLKDGTGHKWLHCDVNRTPLSGHPKKLSVIFYRPEVHLTIGQALIAADTNTRMVKASKAEQELLDAMALLQAHLGF